MTMDILGLARSSPTVILCVLGLLWVCCRPALPAEFFIAPNGRDTNTGSKTRPFATFERARDAIRELRKQKGGPPAGGVTVWIRGGAYRLERTFALEKQDSGTKVAPVTYRACEGERVRLVGGAVIPPATFRPVSDPQVLERLDSGARGKVLQADLKPSGISDFGKPFPVAFRGYAGWPELFFDGKPMMLARWPNEGFARVARVTDSGSKPRWNEKPDRPGTFVYQGERPERWLQADEVYLNGYWAYKWYNECIKVARIDPKEKTITLAAPHVYGLGGPSGGEYYALNLLEELDMPGEYYLNRKTGTLFFWPPEPIAGKEIGLSLLETPMVTMSDTSFVILRNLTFEVSRGMAVTIQGGNDNLIAGCTVRNIATDAVNISGGTNNGVVACDLHNMGGAGISLSGGDRANLSPCGNYADNNHIHHYGRLFRTHRDAIFLSGVGCRASHNLIHDAPHHAMDFGGNDHTVEFNEIHHVCMETDDAGAIYTGRNWTVRGTVIRHNFFHHIGGGPSVGNQAIYLDDTACGTTCFGNVIYKVYRAFLIGGGRDNIVDNNLIVDCPISVHIDNRGMGGEWLEGQEVYSTMRSGLKEVPYQQEPWRSRYPTLANILEDSPGLPKGNEVRRNVMVRCGGMSLAQEAKEWSKFEDNLETAEDVGIVDAEHLDFNLKDSSAVYQRVPGFQKIPFSQIGLRKDEYRRSLPPSAPWIEPAPQAFVDELLIRMRTRSVEATIRYTLDGTEPNVASPVYARPIRLRRSATVKAVAFARGDPTGAHSETVSATFSACRLGTGHGVYLSDLLPVDFFIHGGLMRDIAYGGGPIALRGQTFEKGIITHPEKTPEGGKAHVTFALTGGLARAKRLKACIGVDDSAKNAGSATFIVEARCNGQWQKVFESGVLRGGQSGPTANVDVDIGGAELLRLSVTDAGDGIDSDHAAWAGARLE